MRQGDKKLVYRLIQLFSSTEIFSKRRKIYTRMKENQSYILKLMLNISISTPTHHHQLVGFATWLLRMRSNNSHVPTRDLGREIMLIKPSKYYRLICFFVGRSEKGFAFDCSST